MTESIGKQLAEDLKRRAAAESRLQEEAARKSAEQKASDDAALASLARRVGEEVDAFNQNAEGLPRIALSRQDELSPYTLSAARQLNFSVAAGRLQITILPGHSPLFSTVAQDASGYVYHHIGPNGMATNRVSTEDEVVDGLLRQACGL